MRGGLVMAARTCGLAVGEALWLEDREASPVNSNSLEECRHVLDCNYKVCRDKCRKFDGDLG